MRFRFGPVELDTDTFEVRAGDRPVDVEPQVFDVLALLLAHRDRVVTKEELLDAIWGNRFVSESALTTRIKQARQAVGDDGRSQRVIKTLHGRGYRFVAAVQEDAPQGIPEPPTTHYVVNDGASIAYQTFGEGPNLVLIEGYTTNVEVQWEHPAIADFLRRLGSFSRVVVLDKRGTGLSERLSRDEAPPLEQRADDVRAVMDAVGMRRATVFGSSEGGSLSILLAAAHPDRVERLILHGTWARHPWLGDPDRAEFAAVERRWGTGRILAALAASMGATAAGRRFLGRFERQAATPATARRLAELMSAIDVTPILSSIRVPTLVVHRSNDRAVGIEHARALVAGVPHARLVELPGTDHFMFSGESGPILDAVEEFVVGVPASPSTSDRFLATVLVAEIGDGRDVAAAARDRVAEQHGRWVGLTSGALVATFDGPGRAVRAAIGLRDALGPLGAVVRAGVHTAEIGRRGDGIAGIGVDVAHRLAGLAEPGGIWVSRTLTDLVAGSGLVFAARGTQAVDGLPEPLSVYEVLA